MLETSAITWFHLKYTVQPCDTVSKTLKDVKKQFQIAGSQDSEAGIKFPK